MTTYEQLQFDSHSNFLEAVEALGLLASVYRQNGETLDEITKRGDTMRKKLDDLLTHYHVARKAVEEADVNYRKVESVMRELRQCRPNLDVPAAPAVELCKCGKNPATAELHECPYQAEIHDDHRPQCNCCSDCYGQCCDEI